MAVELQPLGVKCNLACSYCYQEPMRDAGGNEGETGYDLEAMKRSVEAEWSSGARGLALFGGEPLLLPIDEMRELCEFAKARGQHISVQTNGTLVTPAHLALFEEFQVGVGVSMDGPGELNDTRWNGNLASTRALTQRSQATIEELLARGIGASLIVTLTNVNASPERLPRLLTWLDDLVARGLKWLNIHTLEVDSEAGRANILPHPDLVAALQTLARWQPAGVHVAPLDAYRRLLLGQDNENVNCIWHACDPYTTAAVRGVGGRGERGNCGRTNKDGVAWLKGETVGHERQLALYFTPQEHGGCAGCRFFFACKGECPGTAEQGDWRSRTEHCSTIMAMLESTEGQLQREGREPLSLSVRRPLVEARLLQAWAGGQNISIAQAIAQPAPGDVNRPHGDIPHGDAPHGDHADAQQPVIEHGDHNDARGRR